MKNKLFSRIFLICFVAYIVFSVGKVIYQGYQVNKEIQGLKSEIESLRTVNKELSDKILYYQSPSYREKIARERLGLQKPGEKVIVILPEEKPKITEEEVQAKTPNYRKWWDFFFKS